MVYATSRDAAKRDRAVALGAAAAFDSEADWPVKVDVVVESVGPATWDRSVRALRPGGRLVVCGATSGPEGRAEPAPPVLQADRDHRLDDGLVPGVRRGHPVVAQGLPVQVDEVFDRSDYPEALERLGRGEQFGKIVLLHAT